MTTNVWPIPQLSVHTLAAQKITGQPKRDGNLLKKLYDALLWKHLSWCHLFSVPHCVDNTAVVRVGSRSFDIRLLLHSNRPCRNGVPGSRGGVEGSSCKVRVVTCLAIYMQKQWKIVYECLKFLFITKTYQPVVDCCSWFVLCSPNFIFIVTINFFSRYRDDDDLRDMIDTIQREVNLFRHRLHDTVRHLCRAPK